MYALSFIRLLCSGLFLYWRHTALRLFHLFTTHNQNFEPLAAAICILKCTSTLFCHKLLELYYKKYGTPFIHVYERSSSSISKFIA